jgi:polyhydroxyalkanoate synthesis repressor PhaR
MPVIKRYPNRKLYDTEAKQYITLDGIADLIRQGQEVHVVDHATGEDLTALTLSQVIFEQEKKEGGFLPRSILTGLIQAGGDRFSAIQRTLTSPLSFWRQIDEEIRRRVQALINQGEISEGEGHSLIEKLLKQGTQQAEERIPEDEVKQALIDRQVPTRQDLMHLLNKLDSLADQLDDLSQNSAKPNDPPE